MYGGISALLGPVLTSMKTGFCWNFSACFMKDVLFEQRKIKLWTKQHLVENKTDYAACFKKCSKFLYWLNV